MESILIKILDTKKYYQETEKLYFLILFNINRLLPFFLILLIGASLIINGIFDGYDAKITLYEDGEQHIKLVNYGIYLGIGLGLFLFSFLQCFTIWKAKNNFKDLIKLRKNKLDKNITQLTIEITNEKISFKSDIFEFVISWQYFDFYKVDSMYLHLFSFNHSKNIPQLIVPISALNKEEQNLLQKFLKDRFINNSIK